MIVPRTAAQPVVTAQGCAAPEQSYAVPAQARTHTQYPA